MKQLSLLAILLASTLLLKAQSHEVLWNPGYYPQPGNFGITGIQGYSPLYEENTGSFAITLLEAHIRGQITLFDGIEEDSDPLPRTHLGLLRSTLGSLLDQRELETLLAIEVTDSIVYFALIEALPSWVVHESWSGRGESLSCDFKCLILMWQDYSESSSPLFTRTSLTVEDLPEEYISLIGTPQNFSEELSFQTAYQTRRLSMKIIAFRTEGNSEWEWEEKTPATWESGKQSLIEAHDYLSILPSEKELQRLYPTQTKDQVVLYSYTASEEERQMRFRKKQIRMTTTILEELVPQIGEDVLNGTLQARHPDTKLTQSAEEARTRLALYNEPPEELAEGETIPDGDTNLSLLPISIYMVEGQVVRENGGKGKFIPTGLSLVYVDPAGVYPQKPWVSISIEELEQQGYEVNGTALAEVLASWNQAAYPVQINGQGLCQYEEAWAYWHILRSGKWELLPAETCMAEGDELSKFLESLPKKMRIEASE